MSLYVAYSAPSKNPIYLPEQRKIEAPKYPTEGEFELESDTLCDSRQIWSGDLGKCPLIEEKDPATF